MKFIFLFFIFITQIFALDNLSINGLQGNFQNNKGFFKGGEIKGNYQAFGLKINEGQVEINKTTNLFNIKQNDINFSYRFEKDSVIDSLETLNFQDLKVSMKKAHTFEASVLNTNVNIGSGVQEIPKISINCRSKDNRSPYLIPCFDLSLIFIQEINLDQNSKRSVSRSLAIDETITVNTLKNIKINIYQNNFTLELKLPDLLGIMLKASGTIKYDEINDLLVIKLEKARTGILNIKDIVLNEIKNAQLSSVKVSGDQIFINI